jgi:tRNA (guanine37-N1)-methyltransferase
MKIELVTLFPDMFSTVFELGVLGKAVQNGLISLNFWNPRDFAHDRHRTVDDRPYGGGPGMLMKVQPLQDAIQSAKCQLKNGSRYRTIYLSPQGVKLDHAKVQALAQYEALILVSGRYEGVDQRLIDAEIDEEISIGDYVLSGGELASMVLVDAVARLIPGVLGDSASAEEDSFVNGLLDYPHYTRPEEIDGKYVPEVLISGDHKKIRRWRLKQSLGRTWLRRPELLKCQTLNVEQQSLLQEFIEEVNR